MPRRATLLLTPQRPTQTTKAAKPFANELGATRPTVTWLRSRRAAPASRFGLGSCHGKFIIQGLENLDLRFRLAVNKILAEQVPGAGVNTRQTGHEDRLLFVVVPLSDDQVDEFIYPRGLCSGRVGLRDNELGNSRDGRVLTGIEALQDGLVGKLLVHRLEQRKRFPRQQRQGGC
jgi:hypothetical protein